MKEVEVEYQYSTASRVIHKNRCHLVAALITPKEDSKSYIDIYDGENTTAPKMMRLRSGTEESKFIEFNKHPLMQRGIYVYLHGDAESFTVFWEPIED